MFDILALVLISLALPAIALVGIRLIQPQNIQKLEKAFALTFLGLELLRFFYNAKMFPNAVTPVDALNFSYVTLLAAVILLAAFNSGRVGRACKDIAVFTCLVPMVIGLFNPQVYSNELDVHAVIKAAYFLQSGVAVLIAALWWSRQLSVKNVIIPVCFTVFYALLNFVANTSFKTGLKFDAAWFVQMGVAVISCGAVYACGVVYSKLKKESSTETEASAE